MNSRLTFSVALLMVIAFAVNANADVILVADTATGNVDLHVGATGNLGCGTTLICTSGQQDLRLFGVTDGSVPNGYSPPAGGVTGLTSVTINDAFGSPGGAGHTVTGAVVGGIFARLGGDAGTVFQNGSEGTYEEGSLAAASIADGTVLSLGNIFNTGVNPNADFDRYRLQGIMVADGFPSAAPLFAGVIHTAIIPEPASLMCMVLGVMGLMVVRRRG